MKFACTSVDWRFATNDTHGKEDDGHRKACSRDKWCDICGNCYKHCVQHSIKPSGRNCRIIPDSPLKVSLIDIAIVNYPWGVREVVDMMHDRPRDSNARFIPNHPSANIGILNEAARNISDSAE